MSCPEIAALRLSIHALLGDRPDHERAHELADLAAAGVEGGPMKALAEARDLASAQRALDAAALDLETRIAGLADDDPAQGYHRALLVQVRAAQRGLERIRNHLGAFYRDLDETHMHIHELFPGEA